MPTRQELEEWASELGIDTIQLRQHLELLERSSGKEFSLEYVLGNIISISMQEDTEWSPAEWFKIAHALKRRSFNAKYVEDHYQKFQEKYPESWIAYDYFDNTAFCAASKEALKKLMKEKGLTKQQRNFYYSRSTHKHQPILILAVQAA